MCGEKVHVHVFMISYSGQIYKQTADSLTSRLDLLSERVTEHIGGYKKIRLRLARNYEAKKCETTTTTTTIAMLGSLFQVPIFQENLQSIMFTMTDVSPAEDVSMMLCGKQKGIRMPSETRVKTPLTTEQGFCDQ